MEKLKSCPCGGKAEYRRVGDMKQYWVVFCAKCGKTPVPLNSARCTVSGAKREWNNHINGVFCE